MSKNIIATIIATLLILSPYFIISSSAETFKSDVLVVECEHIKVKLGPGEVKTISIDIKNIHNQSQFVYVEWINTEDFGLTKGNLSEDYFQLEPNETKQLKLRLSTSFHPLQNEGGEDGLIIIRSGTELSFRNSGSLKWNTVEDVITFSIDVEKDMTIPYLVCGSLLFFIILGIILIIMYIKKKQKKVRLPDRSEQAGQGPAQERKVRGR